MILARSFRYILIAGVVLACGLVFPASAQADSWAARQTIVNFAEAQIGKTYSMDNNPSSPLYRLGPNAFDCSGLVYQGYAAAGIGLDNSLCDWIAYPIDPIKALPGDLVYMGYETSPYHPGMGTGYHIGVYAGDGYIIHASYSRGRVVKDPIWYQPWTWWGRVPALTFDEGDMPVKGDFNGDHKDDVGIFRQQPTPVWFFKNSTGSGLSGQSPGLNWGLDGDLPFTGDFDGDGKEDLGLYRQGRMPNWFFKLSTGSGFSSQMVSLEWGNTNGDTPVIGDFNGDGKDDIAIHRFGASLNWFFLNSTGTPGQISWGSSQSLEWGADGDIPIVGDFNDDERCDIGIYRRGAMPGWNWKFLYSGADGFSGETTLSWGNGYGEIPITADFDGDGRTDIGLYRSGSSPNWFFKPSSGSSFVEQTYSVAWGNLTGDVPIVGDFDGDEKADICINRFGSSPNWFFRLSTGNGTNGLVWSLSWGNLSGDIPLTGYFNNDIMSDIAIYRPSTASWYVKSANGSGFNPGTAWNAVWGSPLIDRPLTGDFDGDGKTDIGIYRAGSYPNWFFKLSTGVGFAPATPQLSWGNPGGDTPIVGDFNGDGKDDIAIYRYGSYPNWFVLLNTTAQAGGLVKWGSEWKISWGNPGGDYPIVGNFNGDTNPASGKPIDDIGVYRKGAYPNWFILRAKSDGTGFMDSIPANTWSLSWGNPGSDTPVIGDFNGDGVSDIGLYRSSSAQNWYFKSGTPSGFDVGSSSYTCNIPGGVQLLTGNYNGDVSGSGHPIDDIVSFRNGAMPNWNVMLLNIAPSNTVWDNSSMWAAAWGDSAAQPFYAYYLLESTDELGSLRSDRN